MKNRLDEVNRLQKIAGILNENLGGEDVADYSEAAFNLDKFMPEDETITMEYFNLKDMGDVEQLVGFLEQEADMEVLDRYMPEGGTLEGFAEYLINN
jgi:hypothetical protein